MRVGEPIVETIDAVGEDVGGSQPLEPARGRVGRNEPANDVGENRRVRCACGKIGKPWIVGQIRPAQRAHQPDILLIAHQRHHDPAVAGPVRAGRRVQLPRRAALQDMLGELMPQDGRRALRQADFDPLTLAAALARIERDPERLRCVEAGQRVQISNFCKRSGTPT